MPSNAGAWAAKARRARLAEQRVPVALVLSGAGRGGLVAQPALLPGTARCRAVTLGVLLVTSMVLVVVLGAHVASVLVAGRSH